MKKIDKLDILQKCIDEKLLCKCHFSYDEENVFLYPVQVNDKLIVAQIEDEFFY